MENVLNQTMDIIKGHIYEILHVNSEISESRLKICQECPLYIVTQLGPVCNGKLWINPKTNEISEHPKEGYVKGCTCRLDAKTSLKDSKCIINKW